MKKSVKIVGIIIFVVTILGCIHLLCTTQPKETQASSMAMVCEQKRIMCGTYYDYMVIKTEDGKEWLLDDSEESQYIENGAVIFENGERIQVIFDTMGTESITDDVIISITSQEE